MKRQLELKLSMASFAILVLITLVIEQNSIVLRLRRRACGVPLVRSPLKVSLQSTSIDSIAVDDIGVRSRSIHFWVYPGRPCDWEKLFNQSINNQTNHHISYHTLFYAYESALVGVNESAHSKSVLTGQIKNLRDWMSPLKTPPAYMKFIDGHMYFKILYKERYLHHLQSVLVCSFIANNPSQKMLYGNYSVHLEDACEHYDPTFEESQPPISVDFIMPITDRFAVLTYDERVKFAGDANSGDEVQSMAPSQFAPFISDFVDREKGFPSIEKNVFVFANAWYGEKPAFPLSTEAVASTSFISAHMSNRGQNMVTEHVDFWKTYIQSRGPIGARDQPTLDFLRENGLDAYLSSCFTLMYHIPLSRSRNSIVIVDVAQSLLPPSVWEAGVKLECNVPNEEKNSSINRFRYAHRLLRTYSQEAKVIITSRIHVALPCAAMGIPVILVAAAILPGGTGRRTEGIDDLFHLYQPEVGQAFDYDLDNMPHNPGVHQIDRYRAAHWNQLKKVSPLYSQTAHLYGLVPLRRLGHGIPNSNEIVHDNFNLIFTTAEETLNWKMIRTLENIFYHHPNARVTIHSNTLQVNGGSVLDIFVESGYDLIVQEFDIQKMLSEGPWPTEDVERFLSKRSVFEQGPNWYSHESDVLRYLVLWKFGGFYLDLDMYVVRPIPKRNNNIVGKEAPHVINGAAMIFEREHPFIATCISMVLKLYESRMDTWTGIGPSLITEVYNASPDRFNMTVLDTDSFQPIEWQNIGKWCFEVQEDAIEVNLTSTLAMHLNNKVTSTYTTLKAGTLCNRILQESCIFWNEMHTTK